MEWICSPAAEEVLRSWQAVCQQQTGVSNAWVDREDGCQRFLETARTAQPDGALTGTIWKVYEDGHARRVGEFRIEGDGTVTRGPSELRQEPAKGSAR